MLFFIMGVLDSVQWFALLTFTLALFRFQPMKFWRQSALLAPTLKVITLLLNAASLTNLVAPSQLSLIIAAFIAIYGIQLRAAIVMAFCGGITVFLASATVLAGLTKLFSVKFSDVFLNTHPILSPLHVSVLLVLTFATTWALRRYRLGFSFAGRSAAKPRFSELVISEFTLPIAAALTVVLACPPTLMNVCKWYILIAVLSICLAMLLLISYRREMQDL